MRLASALAVVGWTSIWFSPTILYRLGVHAEIIETGAPYARMMAFAYAPMLLAMVWRHLLSAHDRTYVIFWLTAGALPLNAVGNYLLMFGKFGFPAWGLAGAGFSSFIVTSFLLIASVIYVQRHRDLRRYRLFKRYPYPDLRRIGSFLRLGVPIGFSGLGETGIFLLATVAMGIIGPEALAAHAVALRAAGLIYAFPLGLSQAATIRVGFVTGSGDDARLFRVIGVSLGLAIIAGAVYLFSLVIWRHEITSIFIDPDLGSNVFALSVLYLVIVAISQPFECLGTVGAGILRGIKQTKAPMHASLVAYWGFGLSTALLLSFVLEWGGLGIWIGLAIGTIMFGGTVAFQLRHAQRNGDLPTIRS